MLGATVCYHHGGPSRQVQRKAQRVLAIERAAKVARSILGAAGEPLEPLDALVKAQQHCEAMILTFTIATDAICERLGESALTVTDAKGATTAHPYVVELRHWNDQLRQIASGQLRADIDERRAKVSELQLEQMRKRIEGFMVESGRDLTDPAEVRLIQRWFTGEMPSEPAAIEAKAA
jgi:hypothetical protein